MHAAVTLEALSEARIPEIVSACADWQELARYGPPYWRRRSEAELHRKVAAMAGPTLAPEYNYVVVCDGRAVGECSVHSIDYRNRVAQVGVCIWRPEDRRQGFGRASVIEVARWAFGYLGLRKLEAWIVEGNDPSLRLFEALDFVPEGVLRGRYFYAGRHHDVHVLGLLANEIPS